MATKKKTKKKSKPRKTAARGKSKKKPAVKKAPVKAKSVAKKKKKTVAKAAAASRKRVQKQSANIESFASEEVRTRSAGQSGALQGLSDAAGPDSESVDELIEEGNAFEAGVVSGVEAADNADGQEVRTREVPEDDVPHEYLDQD